MRTAALMRELDRGTWREVDAGEAHAVLGKVEDELCPVRIHLLQFEVATRRQVCHWIVRLNEDAPRLMRPADRTKSWLDLRPGDNLIERNQFRLVTEVRPYRTTECHMSYAAVKSGREYERDATAERQRLFRQAAEAIVS